MPEEECGLSVPRNGSVAWACCESKFLHTFRRKGVSFATRDTGWMYPTLTSILPRSCQLARKLLLTFHFDRVHPRVILDGDEFKVQFPQAIGF